MGGKSRLWISFLLTAIDDPMASGEVGRAELGHLSRKPVEPEVVNNSVHQPTELRQITRKGNYKPLGQVSLGLKSWLKTEENNYHVENLI